MKNSANHRYLFFLFVFLFQSFIVFSQIPELEWEKQMKTNVPNYFVDAVEMTGGGFVVLGAREMPGDSGFDVWLLQCNENGDTIHTKVLGNPGNDIPFNIEKDKDSGFLIAAVSSPSGAESLPRLISVDTDFNERWISEAEQPSALPRTFTAIDDDGNAWWLNTFKGVNDKPEVALKKLDESGTVTATYTFKEDFPVSGYAVRALEDGSMAFTCQVNPSGGKPTIQVYRINSDGELLWKTLLPSSEKAITPQCICCSPDNSVLVGGSAGLCYNPDAPAEQQIWDYDFFLGKLDNNGKLLWAQDYNREGSERGTAIAVLPDGNIMAGGKCETSFSGSVGPWLLFVDKNGKLINEKVLKFVSVKDQVARIICTSDGGLLLIGPGNIDTQSRMTGWMKKMKPVL
ncbi:MAG: hypothetical protein V2I54_12985 [Bacteroidales bacterium]|jgi:hypothetical protein|nr:hypothetical protein [Bacteroidales bacterium]